MEAFCLPIPLRLHLSTFLHDGPLASFPLPGPVGLGYYRFGHWLDPCPPLPYTRVSAGPLTYENGRHRNKTGL
jgi:hypothetical protein